MKALNVINTALIMLNEYDLYKYINEGFGEQVKFDQDKKLLIKSLNEATYSISDYYPFTKTETHVPENGRVEFKKFSSVPLKILSVVSPSGSQVTAEIYPTQIKTSEPISITYKYLVKVESLEDELPYDDTPVTENVVAFGLISEYLVYKGRFNEALTYSDKFINGLLKARSFLSRKKLRAREWF